MVRYEDLSCGDSCEGFTVPARVCMHSFIPRCICCHPYTKAVLNSLPGLAGVVSDGTCLKASDPDLAIIRRMHHYPTLISLSQTTTLGQRSFCVFHSHHPLRSLTGFPLSLNRDDKFSFSHF